MAAKHSADPVNIPLVILGWALVCLWVPAVEAQNENPPANTALTKNESQASEGAGAAGESLNSLAEFEKGIIAGRRSNPEDSRISAGNAGPGLSPWRTFGSLLMVLALIIAVTYIFRRWALGGRGGLAPSGVEILARNSINPKQSLYLVKLGPRVLLLGLSPNQMTALHTIEDPDEVAAVMGSLAKNRPQSITNTFGKLLHRESQFYDERNAEQGESNGADEQNQPWYQAQGELASLLDKVKGLARMRFRS